MRGTGRAVRCVGGGGRRGLTDIKSVGGLTVWVDVGCFRNKKGAREGVRKETRGIGRVARHGGGGRRRGSVNVAIWIDVGRFWYKKGLVEAIRRTVRCGRGGRRSSSNVESVISITTWIDIGCFRHEKGA